MPVLVGYFNEGKQGIEQFFGIIEANFNLFKIENELMDKYIDRIKAGSEFGKEKVKDIISILKDILK